MREIRLNIGNESGLLIFQATAVKLNSIFKAEIEGVTNKGVADRYLVTPRNTLSEILKVLQRQIVTRIKTQTALASSLGCNNLRSNSRLTVRRIVACIGLSIELHAVCSTRLCATHHLRIGINEY